MVRERKNSRAERATAGLATTLALRLRVLSSSSVQPRRLWSRDSIPQWSRMWAAHWRAVRERASSVQRCQAVSLEVLPVLLTVRVLIPDGSEQCPHAEEPDLRRLAERIDGGVAGLGSSAGLLAHGAGAKRGVCPAATPLHAARIFFWLPLTWTSASPPDMTISRTVSCWQCSESAETRAFERSAARTRPRPTASSLLSPSPLWGRGRHRDGHAGLGVRQRDEARDVTDELTVERELARELGLMRPDPGAEDGREVVRRELPEQAVERGVAEGLAVVAAARAVEARQAERSGTSPLAS